jgi:hypothetical protein
MSHIQDKPNQHYVQQKYLEPWLVDGMIACLRERKKLFTTNTRNIASQRYFYNLNNLTLSDCKLIRKIFIEPQKDIELQKMLEDWIIPFENLLFIIKNERTADTELMLKNLLEEVYCTVESIGSPGLQKISAGDLSIVTEQSDEFFCFITYLCFQFYRTKNMKTSVEKSLSEYAYLFNNFDSAFNLMVFVIATLFGYTLTNLILNEEDKCYILKNESTIPFITGDQPVINTHAMDNIEPSELSLYYPLNLTKALLINKDLLENNKCSDDIVSSYNNLIVNNSNELLFANSESWLLPYKISSN